MFRVILLLIVLRLLKCASSIPSTPKSDVDEKWIDQYLDHYDYNNDNKWQMRYFENFEFFKRGGPIFIHVGGEWEASHDFLVSGHVYDMAKLFNATLFNTEHRYYGQSHPRPDTSKENLKWLTVEQALGDLYTFVRHIKRIHPELSGSKIIMFGVSYSGSLVTWFKQKHPDLVAGVWSSSAPLKADYKFEEGKNIVKNAITNIGGRQCMERIENAFLELQRLIEKGVSEKIERDLNLCSKLDTSDRKEVWSLFITISEMIDIFVQDSL